MMRLSIFNLLIFFSIQILAQAVDPDPLRFSGVINEFTEWDKKNSFPEDAILFVGSSSIVFWSSAKSFPGLPVINRGFGGSQISDVLHYYDQVVRKYKPSGLVFYSGDNDIAAGKSPEQVFEDFRKLIKKTIADFPGIKIYFIPIKPSLSRWNYWPEMNRSNEMVRNYIDENENMFFVDIVILMLNQKGKPDSSFFLEDGLHLNEKGYELWNTILGDYLWK